MQLNLPAQPVPDRVSRVDKLPAGEPRTWAALDGPGCVHHIFVCTTRDEGRGRDVILRIYFDDCAVPHVEAPLGDFFGVMHRREWYPVNTRYLSVQAWSGYNCYFPMPFARSARIEVEAPERGTPVYMQVDWHRYPGQEMGETRRFCARWRREYPTERYGEDFLMLDADGPGQLLGFAYGVRLFDNVDRWSHGGADNIYVDGEGDHPSFIRGVGGEDTFGTSYGGALHPPETHLHAGMPYYYHEDIGEARPAQRVVGYRFYEPDTLPFRHSLHMRFGCMRNDICATTYWYQEGEVRPFFRLPPQNLLNMLARRMDDAEERLPRGAYDLPLPASGSWWLCGPFSFGEGDKGMSCALPPEEGFAPEADYDGLHAEGSGWLTEGSRALGRDRARWVRRNAIHGFVDFNHVFRAHMRGAGATAPGVAVARCVLNAPKPAKARLRIAWDDRMVLSVNGGEAMDLGDHYAFRAETVEVPVKAGPNVLTLKLSNTKGSNHGGWAFAFRAETEDGEALKPEADAATR